MRLFRRIVCFTCTETDLFSVFGEMLPNIVVFVWHIWFYHHQFADFICIPCTGRRISIHEWQSCGPIRRKGKKIKKNKHSVRKMLLIL